MTAMQAFVWNLILAVFWAFATGGISLASLTVGFGVAFIAIFLTQRAIGAEAYSRRFVQLLRLLVFFVRELIVANVRLAYDIITPRHYMRPAVVAIPLTVGTDDEITLLANLISLTPGTLSLHVSEDRKFLYIHSMYTRDADAIREEIREGLEKRILEVTR
jgi:multicomponent Na+:H+ antiporter subunit E